MVPVTPLAHSHTQKETPTGRFRDNLAREHFMRAATKLVAGNIQDDNVAHSVSSTHGVHFGICVANQHQNRGIAFGLGQRLIEIAKSSGMSKTRLSVQSNNSRTMYPLKHSLKKGERKGHNHVEKSLSALTNLGLN